MFLLFVVCRSDAQIAFINITNHNNGSGTNNLFNRYVSVGQNCFVDWEVWHPALTGSDACGTKTISRLVLRRTADNDPTSVIASAPVYINGICNGKSGNNDRFFVNLASYITAPGRYSVELQADVLPLAGTAYDNSNTRTTWNYMCPPASYLTGTGGPTGTYYTPPGSCSFGGRSDPVGGGTVVDRIPEINPSLNYFTVGDAAPYREMVIFNSIFYDLKDGKFQPGNPRVPASMNGIIPFSTFGLCAAGTVPSFSIGAEVNTFKRTDCSADVTGVTLFYRVYKDGTTAPAYSSLAVPFSDNCPGPSGPPGNTFPQGGSCSNINNVLDQRWKITVGDVNILPTTLTVADAGTWNIEFYLQTVIRNCAGTLQNINGTVNLTTFSVVDPGSPGGTFCTITPVFFKRVAASKTNRGVQIQWEAEDAGELVTYSIEASGTGTHFQSLGTVASGAGHYQFEDQSFEWSGQPAVYYRIKAADARGIIRYSGIMKVNRNNSAEPVLQVQSDGNYAQVQIQHLQRGRYQLLLLGSDGRTLHRQPLQQTQHTSLNVMVPFSSPVQNGIYIIVLLDEQGRVVANRRFVR